MTPAVLFRTDSTNLEEFKACTHYMETSQQRASLQSRLVFPRYSALPYYRELQNDLWWIGSRLINTTPEHRWIANMEWIKVKQLHNATFPTYTDKNFHEALEGEYVVKGLTNSRKLSWNRKMYAKTKRDALNIAGELMEDPLIAEQGIAYRQYIPLETWEIGANGLRFTNEWRYFFLGGRLIDFGYYWSLADDDAMKKSQAVNTTPLTLYAEKLAQIVKNYVNFFVLDLAFTESGHIILVEINDASMSGLSCIEPDSFYFNLSKAANEFVQKI